MKKRILELIGVLITELSFAVLFICFTLIGYKCATTAEVIPFICASLFCGIFGFWMTVKNE